LIKYIGSKRTLVPAIVDRVRACAGATSVLDLFSGPSRVGHALKAAGYRVIANDHNAYAHALAMCYVQADREDVLADAEKLVAEFNALPGRAGYFTETFCLRSRFIQPRNGERIDAIRESIAAKGLPPELEAVMVVSLMEAADRVDSTTGVQMAYLKSWSPRSRNDLELRVPAMLSRAAHGKGEAFRMDAFDAAADLQADVAYLDPPYNQHRYEANYHIWETLVAWDAPEHYGVACKRTDLRAPDGRSPFNSRRTMVPALRQLISEVPAAVVVVSYNDESWLGRDELIDMCAQKGEVRLLSFDSRRYVGATIGVHDRSGERVGTPGRLRNTEWVVVAGPRDVVERMTAAPLPTPG